MISDNFSTDNTWDKIKEFTTLLPSMRYVKQNKNIGIKNNIEYVINNSQTKFIWLLADDDELECGAVEIIKNSLNDNKSVILTNFSTINNEGKYLEKKIQNWKVNKLFTINEYNASYEYSNHSYGLISSVILNKEKWINLPEVYKKDVISEFNFLLWVPGLFTIGESYYISEPLIKFRKYKKKWESEGSYIDTFMIDHVVLPETFKMLIDAGYCKNTIKKSMIKNASGIYQSIYAIKKYNDSIKLSLWLKLIYYYKFNINIFIAFLLYLAPKSIVINISKYKLFQKYKKRI